MPGRPAGRMKAKLGPSKPCPCQSGATYGACCGPLHGGALAPTAEALMRSRYAAFALADVPYLVATLAPEHDDRAAGDDALASSLRETCRTARFRGLTVEAAHEEGETARVTFLARVFVAGADRSFREESLFRRVDGAWRYVGAVSGVAVATATGGEGEGVR